MLRITRTRRGIDRFQKNVQGRQTAIDNRGAGRQLASSDSAGRSAGSAGLPSSADEALPSSSRLLPRPLVVVGAFLPYSR